mgnify:CR=1 FL=1
MKVYQLKLILGKAANYDAAGKLKNQTVTAKYVGEGELENILTDQRWKILGACEISCVNVYDSGSPKVSDIEGIKAINERIAKDIQAGTKPKTEIELLKEQNAALIEKMDSFLKHYENPEIKEVKVVPASDKEVRESLFWEAKKLGLNPAKNIKTVELKKLVDC